MMKGRMKKLKGYFSEQYCELCSPHRKKNNVHCHQHRNRGRHNIKILSDMPTGFSGTIKNVLHDKRDVLQKILAMGLTIGCEIKVKNNATCCGSVIIEVKQSKLVLSNSIANSIVVS